MIYDNEFKVGDDNEDKDNIEDDKKTSVADKMGKAATMSPDINLSLCSTLIIEN